MQRLRDDVGCFSNWQETVLLFYKECFLLISTLLNPFRARFKVMLIGKPT